MRNILVTGATGKVGRHFIARFLDDNRFTSDTITALCHRTEPEPNPRVRAVYGSIAARPDVAAAVRDCTHVLHLATCKEEPELVMDVTVKGLFWLLEECRASPTFQQFILIGGDAAVGHYFYPRVSPVTEDTPHCAYEGCYALSKVLEEVMLSQCYQQYDFNGCCLRAPWIMAADDFKRSLSFGGDVFGAIDWREHVGKEKAAVYAAKQTVPVLCDADGQPLRRNFVHVDDLVSAILLAVDHPNAHQQLFNIAMDEPVDYGKVAAYLHQSRQLDSVKIALPYHSTWLDNRKAKSSLGWVPQYDDKRLVDEAWAYTATATGG